MRIIKVIERKAYAEKNVPAKNPQTDAPAWLFKAYANGWR